MSPAAAAPRRILPPVYLFGAVLLMNGLHLLAPVKQLLVSPYRLLGLLPLIGGVLFVLIPAAAFQRAGTTIRPFERSSALVTGGLYRVSRNPIYAGMAASLAGVGILLGSLSPLLVVPIFVLLIDRRFIREEERMLGEAFGERYAAYRARVRRWL